MIEGIPLPATDDPRDAPYWEAATRGQLVIQRCAGCGMRRFPPRPMCPGCQSFDHAWEPMSGEGKIWSFVIPHPPLLPSFAKIAPYNVVLVELADDPSIRLVGNLVASADGEINEVDPKAIQIGARVRAVFNTVAPDLAMIRWVLA
jgi:uncharacterized OB-fold protein